MMQNRFITFHDSSIVHYPTPLTPLIFHYRQPATKSIHTNDGVDSHSSLHGGLTALLTSQAHQVNNDRDITN
jgi:hypothetical protein